jgi:hypothetical protein
MDDVHEYSLSLMLGEYRAISLLVVVAWHQ